MTDKKRTMGNGHAEKGAIARQCQAAGELPSGRGFSGRARTPQEVQNKPSIHGITSLRTEAQINRERSRDGLLESVLQELCTIQSVSNDPVVDSGQRCGHRLGVLSMGSKFGISLGESRSPRMNDAQQLTLGNNKRLVGFRSSGESS